MLPLAVFAEGRGFTAANCAEGTPPSIGRRCIIQLLLIHVFVPHVMAIGLCSFALFNFIHLFYFRFYYDCFFCIRVLVFVT